MIDTLFSVVVNPAPSLVLPKLSYSSIVPESVLIGGALLLLLFSSLTSSKADPRVYAWYTVLVGAVSLSSTYWLWHRLHTTGKVSAFVGAIAFDHFTLFFVIAISIALILAALISESWLRNHRVQGCEYFVLMMLSASGAMLMASANDLIVIFLGLEILSIALYVLVGFNRRSEQSREAALKYFILGSFASALFLYGIALTYGAIGTTSLSGIGTFLSQNTLLNTGLLLAGMSLLGVGFAFKIAAVPFQQWTPDVYVGAPTPVVGFMAATAKAGAVAALLRVFASSLFVMKADWQPIILVIAVLTLFVGAAVACVQSNVKRMLAYSSISHAGFIILGLEAGTVDGVSAALFYMFTYTFMVLGSFAIVMVVGGKADDNHGLAAYRGLGRRQPMLGLAFTVLLLAQAGLPLTSGFIAKFSIMQALVENGSYATAVFAMITAAIAAFFYLRIVVAMYASHTADEDEFSTVPYVAAVTPEGLVLPQPAGLPLAFAVKLVLAISVAFTVALGVVPQHMLNVIDLAHTAAADLFS